MPLGIEAYFAQAGPAALAMMANVVNAIEHLTVRKTPQVAWKRQGDVAEGSEAPFSQVQPVRPPIVVSQPKRVYVSYAWDDESRALVAELGQRLPSAGFILVQDRNEMRPGDWISSFMREIGRAERVLVVIGKKSLRSFYCMLELLHLFNHSLGDRGVLMSRMVPLIVGKVTFARARDREQYVAYWKREYMALDALVNRRGLAGLGVADREEWLAVHDFQHRVSDLLAWVADTLMPHGVDGIDAAVDLLQRQG